MCKIVENFMSDNHFNPKQLASKIAKRAYLHSKDPNFKSPFSVEARKAGKTYKGGKADDITVVVARVKLTAVRAPKQDTQDETASTEPSSPKSK